MTQSQFCGRTQVQVCHMSNRNETPDFTMGNWKRFVEQQIIIKMLNVTNRQPREVVAKSRVFPLALYLQRIGGNKKKQFQLTGFKLCRDCLPRNMRQRMCRETSSSRIACTRSRMEIKLVGCGEKGAAK